MRRRKFIEFLGVAVVSASAGAGAGYFVSEYERSRAAKVWLGDTTEQNLKNAFSGESQAHVRYTLFANRAEEEGLGNVARLFTAITFAEQVHAGNHFKILSHLKEGSATFAVAGFGPGDTSKNIDIAIDGETFEITEMYPAYKEKAIRENALDAELSFSRALEAEKAHVALFNGAKETVDSGQDMRDAKIYVCPVCGNVFVGTPPALCPICSTPEGKFKIY